MARKTKAEKYEGYCPLYSKACNAGRPDRQRGLTEWQQGRLPDDIKGEANLRYCSYCGAVYRAGRALIGKFDNSLTEAVFHVWKSQP